VICFRLKSSDVSSVLRRAACCFSFPPFSRNCRLRASTSLGSTSSRGLSCVPRSEVSVGADDRVSLSGRDLERGISSHSPSSRKFSLYPPLSQDVESSPPLRPCLARFEDEDSVAGPEDSFFLPFLLDSVAFLLFQLNCSRVFD